MRRAICQVESILSQNPTEWGICESKEMFMKNRILAAMGLALAAVSSASADEVIYVVSNTSNAVYKVTVFNSGMMGLSDTITFSGLVRPYGIDSRHNGDLVINGRGPCTACTGGTFSRLASTGCDAPSAASASSATGNGLQNPHGAMVIGDIGYMVDTHQNRIVRYSLANPGVPVFLGSDPTGGVGAGCRSIEFIPSSGQVIVSDCCSLNGLRRYTIAANGSLTPAGTITGNGLNTPHGMAVSPWGELFVCNINAHTISRFLFNDQGGAVPNGVISGFGLSNPADATFRSNGELQVAGHFNGVILR
ncbi:MAG: hypothetical protein PSX37_05110, partial [bacterium]|nr:hypothetical protein [bacterium]